MSGRQKSTNHYAVQLVENEDIEDRQQYEIFTLSTNLMLLDDGCLSGVIARLFLVSFVHPAILCSKCELTRNVWMGKMKFDDIYQFFQTPPPFYLNKELAVCYVLAVLSRGDSYGTELIQLLETEYPTYRLSDTVLYSALKFLEDEQIIEGYWKKVEGRGRPRRMYQIKSEMAQQAQDLTRLWYDYVRNHSTVVHSNGLAPSHN